MSVARVLSGMRPTGRLHIGHYYGVLANWLKLQHEFECYFFAADWHALTTNYATPDDIKKNTLDMAIDWLSVGIDPSISTMFRQSHIREHAELFVLLGMITPLAWLERNPTYKEQMQEIKDRDLHTFGFLGYPVLQTADIIIYKANKVPVGIDQAPHIELSREIVRRFNNFYGETFPEPATLLTPASKVLGTDGRKMSKSYGNAILLSEEPKTAEQKMLTMMTDTARQRKTDAGNPDVCPFYVTFHAQYSDAAAIAAVRDGCTKALNGCIECKRKVIPKVLEFLEPFRIKRNELEKDPDYVWDILNKGTVKAAETAQNTMAHVRKNMRLE